MCFIGSAQKGGVLIPSVMALRETAMTAPLDQQGEPLPSSVTAAPCHPLYTRWALRFARSALKLGGNFHTTEFDWFGITTCFSDYFDTLIRAMPFGIARTRLGEIH